MFLNFVCDAAIYLRAISCLQAFKEEKPTVAQEIHKIRITLTSKSMKAVEKGECVSNDSHSVSSSCDFELLHVRITLKCVNA